MKNMCYVPRPDTQRWDGGGKQRVGILLDQKEERVCGLTGVTIPAEWQGPQPDAAVSTAGPSMDTASVQWLRFGAVFFFRVAEKQ